MRQRGASIFIYLIFGILIMVFVVNFGPQGGQGACGGSSNSVIEVNDSNVNLTAYRVAYSNAYNPGRSRERVYFALETLVRRELLADAAAERGLRVTGEMVDEEIKKGFFFIGGLRIPLRENIFDVHEDGTRTWNVLKFKRWIANLDVKSTSSYRDEQIRSMQAALMHELLASSARVSREEARNEFLFTKHTVTYDTVTFAPAAYRDAMRLTDADVARFTTTHEAAIKAKYAEDERTYKAVKPQLKLRQILIATAAPTPPADAPADAPAGDATGAGSG
ncbi:MAG: SurA N-terminal domain-containing protein, partial [Deltaproteobacteria bacterium]|nr:SurA N-terminal domain-containing protein [Deltaproteobacteria bacterium]